MSRGDIERVEQELRAVLGSGDSGPELPWPTWVAPRLERLLPEDAVRRVAELFARTPATAAQIDAVTELLRVGETRFYRDPPFWQALPAAVAGRTRTLRAASVGCSTGEEAWTLAMVLADLHKRGGPAFSVVGSDVSESALRTARAGVYPAAGVSHLPKNLADRFVETNGTTSCIRAPLRPRVRFVPRDALNGPAPGSYELILCRNLLIYFEKTTQSRIIRQLYAAISPGGLLVVARSEVARVRAEGYLSIEIAPGIQVFRADSYRNRP